MRIIVRDAYDTTKLCVIETTLPSITVEQLKHEVTKQHPSNPEPQLQRIILAGRILRDQESINEDSLFVLSIKPSSSQHDTLPSMNFQPTPWITLPSSVSSSPIQTINTSSPFTSNKPDQHVQSIAANSSHLAQFQMPQHHQPQAVQLPAAPAVVPPVAPILDERVGYRRYIDVKLMLKLCVLFLVFSRNENASRQFALFIAAVIAYLWQVGAFARRDAQADAAGNEAAAAVRQARRHARGENQNGLAGLLANLGDEQEEDDFEDDIAAQREQLAQMNAQHRAEQIRRNQYHPTAADGTVAPTSITRVEAAEKFIVGLFASLHPSWRIRELDQ